MYIYVQCTLILFTLYIHYAYIIQFFLYFYYYVDSRHAGAAVPTNHQSSRSCGLCLPGSYRVSAVCIVVILFTSTSTTATTTITITTTAPTTTTTTTITITNILLPKLYRYEADDVMASLGRWAAER